MKKYGDVERKKKEKKVEKAAGVDPAPAAPIVSPPCRDVSRSDHSAGQTSETRQEAKKMKRARGGLEKRVTDLLKYGDNFLKRKKDT